MNTYEITDDIFEESSQIFSKIVKDSKIRDRYDPIAFHTFDQYEIFNRIIDDWNDNPEREKEILMKHGPPPLPRYNQKNRGHKISDILDILEEPGRLGRPEK